MDEILIGGVTPAAPHSRSRPLLLNSLWIVLLAAVVAAGITRAIIVRDERPLEKRFGDEYRAYRSRVWRWL